MHSANFSRCNRFVIFADFIQLQIYAGKIILYLHEANPQNCVPRNVGAMGYKTMYSPCFKTVNFSGGSYTKGYIEVTAYKCLVTIGSLLYSRVQN